MNAIAAYGLDPVVTIGAAAAIIVLLAAWVVIRVRRARSYRPIVRMAPYNPLPPGDSVIEEIRREVAENERRGIEARAREARDRAERDRWHRLEAEWRADGEIELAQKKG